MRGIDEVLIKAARAGGEPLAYHFGHVVAYDSKDDHSPVTKADLEAEEAILSVIRHERPHDGIISEESGTINGDADTLFIIDALDGTQNFLDGIYSYALSIGVSYKGELVAGVVHNPTLGLLVHAEKGKGVFRNGEKISAPRDVGRPSPISFGYGRSRMTREQAANLLAASLMRFRVRQLGSSAFELGLVVCGGLSAHISLGTEVWDSAGGLALVQEMERGIVTDLEGNPWSLGQDYSIASSRGPEFHSQLVDFIQGFHSSKPSTA